MGQNSDGVSRPRKVHPYSTPGHGRMARGGHGLPKVSSGLPCPTLLRSAGGPPLKRSYGCLRGDPPTGQTACGSRPSSTPFDTSRRPMTPGRLDKLSYHFKSYLINLISPQNQLPWACCGSGAGGGGKPERKRDGDLGPPGGCQD
jgi:hypothetical protein